jgi:hypothetical protein
VAVDQVGERALQRRHVEVPGKPHRQRDHIGRAAALQTIQEPQAPLRIRQRNLGGTCLRSQHRTPGQPLTTQTLRQGFNRRSLEHAAQRKLHIQHRTHTADQTRRKQRVTAKRKEVLIDPDPVHSQDLGKQAGENLLLRGARQTPSHHPVLRRRRQRQPVELAILGQRKALQHHDRRRHHVVGQMTTDMGSQG